MNAEKIAKLLGAKVVPEVPGGGAFGAAHLGRIVATHQSRPQPGHTESGAEGAQENLTVDQARHQS